jgi:hypothetical protein
LPRVKGQTAPPGTGKHYKPHPVDFAIIERLPNEGSMLGYHTIAMPVIALVKELNQGFRWRARSRRTRSVAE